MLNSCVLYYSYGVIFLVFSQSLWVWIILFVGALITPQWYQSYGLETHKDLRYRCLMEK